MAGWLGTLKENEWRELCATCGDDVNTRTLIDRLIRDEVLKLARGIYQRELLKGHQSWSGSTLSGRQRQYGVKYANSRRALSDRILASGFEIEWLETPGGRMVPWIHEGPHRVRWRAMGLKEPEIRRLVKVTRRIS